MNNVPKIKLSLFVGQDVTSHLRDGSSLTGVLSENDDLKGTYSLGGRVFLSDGKSALGDRDRDIVKIQESSSESTTTRNLLALLSKHCDTRSYRGGVKVQQNANGEFVLAVLEDRGPGAAAIVSSTVVFSVDGEDTGKGSTTLFDLVNVPGPREMALAKLTAEERELLGL